MNHSPRRQGLALLTGLLLAAPLAYSQTVLLQDDFNDSFLDGTLWTTDTDQAPPFFAPRDVIESGGSIVFTNRGYLATTDEFDPVANEGIRITGTWRTSSPGDQLTVLTRSNALRSGNQLNVSQGIACHIRFGFPASSIAIERMEFGFPQVLGSAGATVGVGETVAFELIDDGVTVTFSVFKLGGDMPVATVTAAVDVDNPTDRVVFHNGSGPFGFYFANLDNVVIESLAVEEEPPTPEELLVDAVDSVAILDLPKGTANSLTSKLDNALLDLALGDLEDALGKLNAFIHQVRAQTGKKIAPADAETLIATAEEIITLVLEEAEA